mmetsp:Transcript_34933/g.51303  ORF Transcript_34933/g.51303 Transcript_34933/m.51303 type:complete len:149 (+) Transcript_34933:3-449(+)
MIMSTAVVIAIHSPASSACTFGVSTLLIFSVVSGVATLVKQICTLQAQVCLQLAPECVHSSYIRSSICLADFQGAHCVPLSDVGVNPFASKFQMKALKLAEYFGHVLKSPSFELPIRSMNEDSYYIVPPRFRQVHVRADNLELQHLAV